MSNSIDINLTDSWLPPSAEEREELMRRDIEVFAYGSIIDAFALPNAPEGAHYEWHRDDPQTRIRLERLGFKRNDQLASTSEFAQKSDKGVMISDVVCYTIPKWRHEDRKKAFEISKQKRQDPRTDIDAKIKEIADFSIDGEGFVAAPKTGDFSNQLHSRKIEGGLAVKNEILSDLKSKT